MPEFGAIEFNLLYGIGKQYKYARVKLFDSLMITSGAWGSSTRDRSGLRKFPYESSQMPPANALKWLVPALIAGTSAGLASIFSKMGLLGDAELLATWNRATGGLAGGLAARVAGEVG